jgi:hypothetical protein
MVWTSCVDGFVKGLGTIQVRWGDIIIPTTGLQLTREMGHGSLIVGMIFWNYYLCVTTPPGSIPPGWVRPVILSFIFPFLPTPPFLQTHSDP